MSEFAGRHVVKGISTSGGIGMGEIYVYEQTALRINRGTIAPEQIDAETERLETAISMTLLDVFDLRNDILDEIGGHENQIFEVYKLILEDRYFVREIIDLITTQRHTAENAVDMCVDNYIQAILQANNEYAIQRIHDLNDIKARVIKKITGESKSAVNKVGKGQVIAVDELNPSIAAMLGRKKVAGVAAAKGAGFLSHAAIILRGMGIPTLNEVNFEEVRNFNSRFAVADGEEGLLVINPEAAEVEAYRKKQEACGNREKDVLNGLPGPTTTKDGHRVGLHANISNIEEYNMAVKKNVDGIGLVRTEMLFINSKRTPGEKEQFYIYSRIAKKIRRKPVVIRTLDIGDDKLPVSMGLSGRGGYENLRGIRRSLAQKDVLVTQIRSIMRASEFGNISISFPMVNDAGEVREVKKLIEDVRADLAADGINPGGKVNMGVTIETREAVENIDSILSEVDFISLGTNDLYQQVMKTDREISSDGMGGYFHPEFLKVIKHCVERAKRQHKRVSVCGEMAAEPLASVILLGLGVDDLSIRPAKSHEINGVLKEISLEEAKDMAQKAVESSSAEEVKSILKVWMTGREQDRD